MREVLAIIVGIALMLAATAGVDFFASKKNSRSTGNLQH